MKNTNTYKIATFFVVLILHISCSEERLDLLPLGVIGDETFFATPDGPYQALWGVYKQLQYDGYSGTGEVVMGSCTSDDAEFGGEFGGGDQPEVQDICYFKMTPTTPLMALYWTAMYQGIQRATTIIYKLPNAEYTIPENEKDKIIAEARCLRAFFYLELTKVFGGVFMYDAPPTPDEFASAKRSSLAENYDFIESELLAVVPLLPETNGPGRMNKYVAHGILTKLYVYESSYAKNYPGDNRFAGMEEKWNNVLVHAEAIINSGFYNLVGKNGETYPTLFENNSNALKYLFTISGENCEESILEIQFNHDTRPTEQRWLGPSKGDVSAVLVGQGSRYYPSQGCRWVITQDGKEINMGGQRFGYNCPSDDFMDEMNSYFPDDPRIDWWIGQPGDSVFLDIDGVEQWVYMDFRESPTGRSHKKVDYIHYSQRGPNWDQNAGNIRIMRLADVILWAAEAEFNLGNEPKAREYVNTIRSRARANGYALNNGHPANFTSSIEFADIVRERRIELCFEQHRYWDLVRWGLADEEISGFETRWAGIIDFEPGKHEFFPIPQLDVDKSNGSIEQNPGY